MDGDRKISLNAAVAALEAEAEDYQKIETEGIRMHCQGARAALTFAIRALKCLPS